MVQTMINSLTTIILSILFPLVQWATAKGAPWVEVLCWNDCVWSSTECAGQVGLGVGSWPSNRATEGSNPKGTRLYFVNLLKNEEKIFDWHLYNRLKDALMCR